MQSLSYSGVWEHEYAKVSQSNHYLIGGEKDEHSL